MKRKKAKEEGAPAWMTTFADMMTLLLCFFVILFSMSQIEKIKFAGLASSLNSAFQGVPTATPTRRTPLPKTRNKGSLLPFAGTPGRRNPTPTVGREKGSPGIGGKAEQAGEPSATRKLVKAAGLEEFAGMVHVEEDANFLKIRLPGDITFKGGQAGLRDASDGGDDVAELMERIAMVLRWIPNKVLVIGHTDDTPTSGKHFPSNWELSAARASTIVRYLSGKFHLESERFTVVGKAASQPLVVSISKSAKKKNRRVELWIRKNKDGGDPLQME